MSSRKFQRRIEDFICENCGGSVAGNGYTNHCPTCLWSKHVDCNPGDRLNECKGAMEPVRVEVRAQKYWIHHQCLVCGFQARVRSSPEDSFEALLRISARAAGSR